MSHIILASASPRRRELLNQIGMEYDVIPSTCEEDHISTEPEEVVEELSMIKAADVAGKLPDEIRKDCLVIGADTIVVYDGEILGKPADEKDAIKMLHRLQGKTHSVYTGVTLLCLRSGSECIHPFVVKTDVTISEMNSNEIKAYVATGEPMDKAGSYGIQGIFAKYVSGINGEYANVVGLPVARLYQEMKMFL